MIPYLILFVIVFIGIVKGDIEKSINKKRLYFVLSCLLIFFTCFHYRLGNDSLEMEDTFYPSVPTLDNLKASDILELGSEPLFILTCSILKSIWNNYLLFQIVHGLFVSIVLMKFFWRRSFVPFIAVFIYFTFTYYYYNFEVQRQSIAIGIFLLIENYIREKKYFKYCVGSLLAFGFHFTGIFLLALPFIKIKINKKSWIALGLLSVILFIIGTKLQNFADTGILLATESLTRKLYAYTDEERMEGGINLYFLITKVIFPLFFVVVGKKHIREEYHTYLFFFLIFSFTSSFSVAILNRFADYFTPFYILMLANYIYLISQTKRQPVATVIKTFVFLFVFTFNFYSWFMIKSYNPKLRNYVKIYPYSSVFFPEKSPDRENAGWKYLY